MTLIMLPMWSVLFAQVLSFMNQSSTLPSWCVLAQREMCEVKRIQILREVLQRISLRVASFSLLALSFFFSLFSFFFLFFLFLFFFSLFFLSFLSLFWGQNNSQMCIAMKLKGGKVGKEQRCVRCVRIKTKQEVGERVCRKGGKEQKNNS